MRFYKPGYETTFASNPGGVEIDHRVYARYFPEARRLWLGGLILGAFGILGLIATRGTSLIGLFVGLRLGSRGYRGLRTMERRFLGGCALPGVVVSTEPLVVAAMANLSTGGGRVYDTVKLTTMPQLAKAPWHRFATGDRVPVIANFSGAMPTPKWSDFWPTPVVFGTDDPAVVARVEEAIGETEWAELNEALFQIPKPYQNGLFPVQIER